MTVLHEFHLPGRHDQSTHGRRGVKAVASAAKVRVPKIDRAAQARMRSAEVGSRRNGTVTGSLRGGSLNDGVDLVNYPDGSKAVRKWIRDIEPGELWPDVGVSAKHQVDAEVLSGLVGAQLGVTAPAVAQDGDNSVLMDFMDGQMALKAGQDGVMAHLADEKHDLDADLVGLFDAITDNQDRNRSNWMIGPNGETQLIDHALNFLYTSSPEVPPNIQSDFSERIFNTQWGRRPEFHNFAFSQADMREVRRRLHSLKPDFEARGRGDWHKLMMRRLKAMTPYATGTENRIK